MTKTVPTPSPLEPTTRAFVDGLPDGPPIYTLTLSTHAPCSRPSSNRCSRRSRRSTAKTARYRWGRPGRPIFASYARPAAREVLPAIIYIHGGGWVLGDKQTHDRLVRELAVGAGAALIFVDYDRSPESRYPHAIEQAHAVARHVADHAAEYRIDPARIAIAGDSVGGNMAAAVTLLAKERGGPDFRAQLLFYPVTDAAMDSASYKQFADGPWLTAKRDGVVLGSISARRFTPRRDFGIARQRVGRAACAACRPRW